MLKMATRLDRLWILLDSGTTPVTRRAAALQIGEVQRLHPHELNNLLRKVCTYLTSKSWETRIAAGQAVEAIVKNVKPWQPTYQPRAESEDSRESTPATDASSVELLSFDSFDIQRILSHGTSLLSSTGEEYSLENDPEYEKMTPQEKAVFYRQQLMQRLGLTAQGKVFSTGIEKLIDDADLIITPSTRGSPQPKPSSEVKELSALQLSRMSARERNRAKRKAKQMARRNSQENEKGGDNEAPPPKKPRTTNVVVEQAGQSDKLLIDQVTDTDSVFEGSEEWPLNWFCEEMFRNLFNPAWEVRHGAATALREVIKCHGDTAGLSVHTPPEKYSSATQSWLEDAAIRLLCVFALDRFADFVSDQVVVPVCATCAQALGTVVRTMEEERVGRVVEVLLSLSAQQEWEVRHASLMGIQHLLAARTDLSAALLPLLSPSILRGLQDVDDDVRAVAASALLPVADQLHLIMPKEVPTLLTILWNSLTDLDDLSASTSSIMGLLCTLLSKNPTLYASHTPEAMQLASLVPRLWPFLSHTNTAVRQSCLQVLLTLLQSERRQSGERGREEGMGQGGREGREEEEAMETSGGEGRGRGEGGEGGEAGEREGTEVMEVGREQAREAGDQGHKGEGEVLMAVGQGREGAEGGEEGGKGGLEKAELGVFEEGRGGGGGRGGGRGGGGVGGSGERPQLHWLSAVLQGALCHLFQRFALEGDTSNMDLTHQVWGEVVGHCSGEELGSACTGLLMIWLCLAAAPSGSSVEPTLLTQDSQGTSSKRHLGGSLGVESVQQKEEAALGARVNCARALGLLAAKLSHSHPTSSLATANSSPAAEGDASRISLPSSSSPSPSSSSSSSSSFSATSSSSSQAVAVLTEGLRQMLARASAVHRMVASLVIGFWGQCPSELLTLLSSVLTEQITYEEIMPFLVALQRDCHVLVVAFDKKGHNVSPGTSTSGYTAEFAAQLATKTFESSVQASQLTPTEKQEFETHRRNLLTALGHLQEELQRSQTRVHCCVAGALVILRSLPPKLNPIIRPLMDCVKVESDGVMQSLSAKWLSHLLDYCKDRSPTPNTKIIKNLCTFACCDPHTTPPVRPASGPDIGPSSKKGLKSKTSSAPTTPTEEVLLQGNSWRWDHGIITLVKQHEQFSSRRVPHGRGRPSAAVREALAAAAVQEKQKPQFFQRRGAESALTAIARHFGPHLFTTLPQLWSHITSPLHHLPTPPEGSSDLTDELVTSAQSVVNSLQVLEVVAPALHSSLKPQLLSLLPLLLSALRSPFTAVRHMSARCVAATAQVDLHQCLQFLVKDVIPYLGDTDSPIHRQGAIETTACVLETAGLQALCYSVLLIMPVLGRLSDQREEVRLMASRCFATLVTLMPLESGVDSPPEMPPSLAERRQSERKFLEQLLDISKLESYTVPVPIKADLRKYQQDGINWLAFLNKYNLHGILCDDMGLGKTLQSLCIIAGDHHYRDKEYKSTGRVDAAPLPSLVVCPPTLTGHWYYEVSKFCNRQDLSPLLYSGPPNTRARLQNLVPNHNLVIASYDIVRNDIKFFRSITWNYCILDEGHIIKNTTTKITKAVKQLRAHHRLILSGTPIQNNVLELWSLFDFLMPGFLGTEKQFTERFGKPILLSRDAKSSSKEQEAGALAMESLHRQVLPFLLRRMKEDVLQDLPPKIIQDYQCELSPLQIQLYEDFARSKAKKAVEDNLTEEEEAEEKEERRLEIGAATHIFQALQYLRKVCNHPSLVVTEDHPMFSKVQDYLKKTGTDLRDIRHATKLQALKQLLHDCGIGVEGEGEGGLASAVGQHRILIFCQFKGILDIIENDLFKMHMPSVTYLRLDGSIPASSRFGIVHKFNSDPSVDVLLLTTHVGGLGLNLTGADTVIFFEHDWNPMKDLQAMDRAHRIGQKKVVNVYRLITKGTLEEKIMSLQKFKLNIANTVISQDNSSLQSMNTAELLDLFQLSDTPGNGKETSSAGGREKKEGMKQILETLPTLWDEEQYKTEYDLSTFMQSLSAVKKD